MGLLNIRVYSKSSTFIVDKKLNTAQTLKQILEFCSRAKIVALMDNWKKETSGQATER